ncbi:MAG: hypothetical protein GC155_18160 [Alphaproteobacteria bacterium]|nr:hypothetical protein [Alphaproteobacteria bacterium]
MTADEIRALLLDARICRSGDDLVGLDAAEIARWESALGVRFPRQYRELLSAIGARRAQFYVGTDLFRPDLTEAAADMLDENDNPITLPSGTVVLSMHQGYQFDSLVCGGRDDPPVHHFLEGRGWTLDHWPSLTAWIVGAADWHRKYL